MANSASDVQQQLEKAVAGDSDSSTGEKETATVTEDAKTDDGMVPRSRLNEVSGKLKDATSAWEAEKADIGTKLAEAQTKATELAEVVAKSRDDTELVSALKTLSRDPRYTDLISRVDSALAGNPPDEEESAEEDDASKTGTTDRKALLAEVRGEMETALTEQRQEVSLFQAAS